MDSNSSPQPSSVLSRIDAVNDYLKETGLSLQADTLDQMLDLLTIELAAARYKLSIRGHLLDDALDELEELEDDYSAIYRQNQAAQKLLGHYEKRFRAMDEAIEALTDGMGGSWADELLWADEDE